MNKTGREPTLRESVRTAELFGRARERARIVRLLRRRVKELKGKAWPHADHSLSALADEIENLK